MLVELVSKGGNFLLNIGPAADGTIPVIMEERLLQIGQWLEVNGDAIYGTRLYTKNPQKDTYKGLTYEWMRNHIATHEPEEVVEEKLNAFDEMVYISKCHRGSLRYPTIKKWFLKEYPDVAKFGTVEVPEEAQEEAKSQNVIPMPEVQAADDAA